MFSWILKIRPQLENTDLQNMERTLSNRFKRLAKRFGSGIANAIKGGGVLGLAVGLIDKILNPLKEVKESIDKMLKSSDDIVTNAQQFGTSTGRLFKLIQLGRSAGLDQDNLFQLLTKFQTAVAQAKANPNDPVAPAVKNYVDGGDTAQSFFSFIQALQTMDKNQQVLVQQAVFGEKQILKMADFLQTDFVQRLKDTGLDRVNSEEISKSIEKTADLNQLADNLLVMRETNDVIKKSALLNEGIVRSMARSEELELERERQRIASYKSLATISQTTDKMVILMEKGLAMVGDLIGVITPAINNLVAQLQKLTENRWIRGIFGKDK